ncbi:hypothetical protein IWW34DRAFT_767714 [Fusarium oxysporum f. sp. albedinis]|nr:hypothetical protein IWW34DRAFT_767714 [Fusarium oxysporum f. sp. albedinis]
MSEASIALGSDATRKHTTEGYQKAAKRRRRASRACLSCRRRKVRCDVVQGSPCCNCKWDNIECVVVCRRHGHLDSDAVPSQIFRGPDCVNHPGSLDITE